MRKAGFHTLSIAAPAYNEAAGIEAVATEWIAYLKAEPVARHFEIVICNDGSRDRTGVILEEISRRYPELKPVHHSVNQGAAAALTTAIRNTSGDWVLLLDSDGQFPIRNLPAMLAAMDDNTVAVTGARLAKRDSAFAQIGSALSGWLCNRFHGTRYRDFNCALKLVRGDILRSLPLEARGLNYSGEITSKLLERGVAPVEVEVEHRDRKQGVSSARRFRSAMDRLLFVLYIGFRQFLIRQAVLRGTPQRRLYPDARPQVASVRQAAGRVEALDLRNGLSALFEADSATQDALVRFLEYRIPAGFSADDAELLEGFANGRTAPEDIRAFSGALSRRLRDVLQGCLKGFFDDYRLNPGDFELAGRSLGSLVLAGAFLKSDDRFSESVQNLAHLFADQTEPMKVSQGAFDPNLTTKAS